MNGRLALKKDICRRVRVPAPEVIVADFHLGDETRRDVMRDEIIETFREMPPVLRSVNLQANPILFSSCKQRDNSILKRVCVETGTAAARTRMENAAQTTTRFDLLLTTKGYCSGIRAASATEEEDAGEIVSPLS